MPIFGEGDAFQCLQHRVAEDRIDLVVRLLACLHVQVVVVEHKQHNIADGGAP